MDLLQNFRNKQIIRSQIQCPQNLNILLDHCQYIIHAQFDKNSKHLYKFKKRKNQINPFFQNAFQSLNRQQKVRFYLRIVQHIQNLSKGLDICPKITQVKMKPIQGQCQCRSFNLKIWKLKNIRLDRTRHQVMVQNEKDNKIKTYELKDYLIRKSKNKSKNALVLQAINQRPHQKSRQVYINFKDSQSLRFWYNLIRQEIQVCEWLFVKQVFQKTPSQHNSKISQNNIQQSADLMNTSITSIDSNSSKNISQTSQFQQQQLLKQQQKLLKQEEQILGKRKTFIDHLVDDDCANFQQFFDVMQDQTDKDIQLKRNLDFFHKLMPDYQLDNLLQLGGYQTSFIQQGKIHILKNIMNPYRFKLIATFNNQYTLKHIFCMISQPRYATTINDNIEQQTTKTLLKSENSAIIYQTLKAYNKFYRLRDFVFVRHAFTHNNNFYLVDKSLDNINFPPFMTLVRGQLSVVWGIIKDEKSQQIKLVGDFVIVNAGLLNDQQEANLSLRYLNGFKQLLKQQPDSNAESSMFDIDWNIDKKQVNKKFEDIRVRRKTIQVQKEIINVTEGKQSQKKFTKKTSSIYEVPQSSPQPIQKHQMINEKQIQLKSTMLISSQSFTKIQPEKQRPEKQQPQKSIQPPKNESTIIPNEKINKLQTELQVVKKLDKDGYVFIDKSYTKKKFIISPIQKQPYNQYTKIKGHAIWKGDWIHDTKAGGIIFINQKKIEDQKGVLKFILTKIGKNILSGKSILNISLPVDIFSTQSNLQRFLLSMAYGPKLLQNKNDKPLLQKLTSVVAFGLTNSVLYLSIQKPFNPILGQTFQCWINGCPGYGQQISHHPPIAGLMFYGRGYTITSQLQSKVQLHMNSGCGTNQGIYKVKFDDGTEICFMTPGGQISGLTFGQRKFNLVGKSYYWSQKERIFLQLNFDAGKKSFFSKQQNPGDYVQGRVFEVTPQFFKGFLKTKKRQINEKQKVKQLGKFQGIWSKYLRFNNEQIFHFDKSIPIKIQYQKRPLASDSNWREDIEYRRLNKITRAQAEKQRLEVLQRTDRKLRQKYGKK